MGHRAERMDLGAVEVKKVRRSEGWKARGKC